MLRQILGKLQQGGVSRVLAPDQHGNMMERTAKEDIEEACLVENDRRFRQASGTPFLSAPLLDMLGPQADSAAADAVLAGAFEPPAGADPHALKLLEQLKMPESVRNGSPVHVELDVDKCAQGWKLAKEFTSSSESGPHFGHCKAGAQHPGLCKLDAIMSNIPHRTGYSPPRWKSGVNVMLEKKAGDVRVHQLRTILLCEADFNQNNKLCGRDVMVNAERHEMLAPEQCGSRVGHSALSHCLNKKLTFDLSRQKKRPVVFISTDLVSCYDRTAHPVASLAMRATGVPSGPVVGMFATIQDLEHHIQMFFGDSEISFHSNDPNCKEPISGTGQGNGAGPTMWAVVSIAALKMLRQKGCICQFESAITGEEVSFVGFAFVDDMDKSVSSPLQQGTDEELEQAAVESG